MNRKETLPIEIGIISDTHGLLRPELLEALDGVEHILHAGDVGPVDILLELETIAPVHAVSGNTDGFDIRLRVPEVQHLELGSMSVAVMHGHQVGNPEPSSLAQRLPDADLVVFGHTHKPLMERTGGRWFVNPGSCGPRRFTLPVTMVRGRISEEGFSGKLIHLV